MTEEQEKALKIVQSIEANALSVYTRILVLETELEDAKGQRARLISAEISLLEEMKQAFDQLALSIERAFGIAWQVKEATAYQQHSAQLPGQVYDVENRTMIRIDGKIRYDYKIKLSGGFCLNPPSEQETGILSF